MVSNPATTKMKPKTYRVFIGGLPDESHSLDIIILHNE